MKVHCPVCSLEIEIKSKKEQVTCPECKSSFPAKWAIALYSYEQERERRKKNA